MMPLLAERNDMSLIEFRAGELALSSEINSNFRYLDDKCSELADNITTSTSGFSSQVAALNNNVQNLLSYKESFISVGMILPYVGSIVPDGYLICDGSELLIRDYQKLYSVIGTTFGSSDSTLFNLPDLRNRTLWGAGTISVGEYLNPMLPNIKGTFRLAGTEGSSSVTGAFSAGKKGGSWGIGHDNSATNPLMQFNASAYSDIYSDDCNTVQPPALVLDFIIKY